MLCAIWFGPKKPACVSAAVSPDVHPSLPVKVPREPNGDVLQTASDGEVRWCAEAEYRELLWTWKANPRCEPLGNRIGEYSRAKLTDQQQLLFQMVVDQWFENEWLVPHDEGKHEKPAAVLPLLAQVQEHKETTPVWPCLDYRCLNKRPQSEPGLDAVMCQNTLRKWRLAGDARDHKLLDIRKAYHNVRVAPKLLQYQIVLWKVPYM